ncbi:MAG: hypothetical protein WD512_03330 [Candidatus Paceibacterota bacterium]
MKEEITLVLTKDCFDTLEYDDEERTFRHQYQENCDCPIARATKRQFPNAHFISVNPCSVQIGNDKYYHAKSRDPINDNLDVTLIQSIADKLKHQSKVILKLRRL